MKKISTEKAPAAIGPYSPGIVSEGKLLFISGQLPIVPETGSFASSTIEGQTEQSIKNVQAIVQEAGSDLDHVTMTTVLLADINDFSKMNEVYGRFFQGNYPARAAFQVAALPMGALVEIQVIAEIP